MVQSSLNHASYCFDTHKNCEIKQKPYNCFNMSRTISNLTFSQRRNN